ncbi:nitroreductase family deazaflavin-dependent oxidoreductase [Microbacterium rhizosphaerae]|jgi:deazaflavin-dependent oxidoreductase (nitroreductase family)|uniref:Nitroreductase family deazaflavin-dependent oxidoreductase n=1 Tax=Microbacterium rhizosphaerae TaxID=1678237 RepID=A0ABZ0SNW7_9MICO|nr:nitroreductase family deazaflavin-dependent oxidoreductase [Microbacterium rhizosphaerae]WPR88981.1 nitroreductase family deazaflavin-dependent oxidoreductase [Microbacterium rhizosphaerae]
MAKQSFSHRLQKSIEPLALAMSGRRWFPLYAVVNHRGRRSGTAYKTPVAVVPTVGRGSVLIGLPWGRETNWARNVIAAGGVDLTWKGRTVHATNPRIIDAVEATALTRALFRPVVKRMPGAIVLHEQTER